VDLDNIIIGTTGLCNASCVHCPTNKPETEHVPRLPMTMRLYEKLLDGLGDHDVRTFAFGLFGDGLLDPFINERVDLTLRRKPGIGINVTTNGAAYSREKHKNLRDKIQSVNVHIESLQDDVYDHLMAPLRLSRVLPKIDMILEDFGAKVILGLPVHKKSVLELENLTDYFLSRGGGGVFFLPLSNRTSEKTVFDELAFAPFYQNCKSDILNNLIIDFDGKVLICCNDFSRKEVIGDLSSESLVQIVHGARRRKMREMLDGGQWACISTCKTCRWDSVPLSVLDGDAAVQRWKSEKALEAICEGRL